MKYLKWKIVLNMDKIPVFNENSVKYLIEMSIELIYNKDVYLVSNEKISNIITLKNWNKNCLPGGFYNIYIKIFEKWQ